MEQAEVELMVADVSRRWNVTPARVRQLANEGTLPSRRTVGGVRLFRLADVERVGNERAEARRGGVVADARERTR
jgi:DNA-binding transcriptional MerR regulator